MDEATRLRNRFYLGSAPSRNNGYTYIVLCAKEYQPSAHVLAPAKISRVPFADEFQPLSPILQDILDFKAQEIADAWENGENILVSCIMGRNRSALVSALALSEISGEHPGVCAEFIRKTRIDEQGVPALQNPMFWDYLQNYPEK